MALRLVSVDRETPMLLPPDLRDWVPANHIAHFILEAVEVIPESAMHLNWRGSGSQQYPPSMMLALLIYAYSTGRFGSREIEGATHQDVALRYICADLHPDHDTICSFRRENRELFKRAFVSVLETAAEMKVLKRVGNVAIDGSKVMANASKHSAVSYQRAGEMITELELEVERLLKKAEETDASAAPSGLDIPAEIMLRQKRLERLKEARAVIEQRAKERAQKQRAEYEAKLARRRAIEESGKKPRGKAPKPPKQSPEPKDQYNFTDPESRIMKAGNSTHFEQCYNAQAAVDADGSMLILGEHLSDAPNDKEQLVPGLACIETKVKEVETVLVDSGYYSEAAVRQAEKPKEEGPSPLTVYAAMERQAHHRTIEEVLGQNPPMAETAPDRQAPVAEQMRHRLSTTKGRELYGLRKQTVEPVFGIIKERMGFRRFHLRGKAKAALEWTLVCLTYNVKRLHRLAQHALISGENATATA